MKKALIVGNFAASFATLAMVDPEGSEKWAFLLVLAWFGLSAWMSRKKLQEWFG
jgi:hypothetical protein